MRFHLALVRCLDFWKGRGKSRAQLAKKVGCSVSAISHWANNRRPIERHFAKMLFEALVCTLTNEEEKGALSALANGYCQQFPDRPVDEILHLLPQISVGTLGINVSGLRPNLDPRAAAVLVAKVVDYTAMVRRNDLSTVQMMRGHIRAFEPHIALHQGQIVKRMHDRLIAEFVSAVEALSCAVELQKTAMERNQGLTLADQVIFRIGIHAGEITDKHSDTHDNIADTAAHLEGTVAPGSIAISAKVFESIRGPLDFADVDRGLQTFRNNQEPFKIIEINTGSAAVAHRPQPDLPNKPSIAILPLLMLSENAEDEFFADGLTEDLTTALSSVPWLFVISRNSAFTYKGLSRDIRQIGQELGVRYVVEGSVRRFGNRIRLSAQLADATDGEQIWADRYDGLLEDVFDLQDRIVSEIVQTVVPQIQSSEIQKSVRKRPDDHTSYDHYLNALNHLNTARVGEAEIFLQKAVDVYPDYAGAKALLAWCTTLRVAWRSSSTQETLNEKGARLCNEALESAQRDIETEAYAGYTLAFQMHNIELGMDLVAHAVERYPSFSWAWTSRSFLESFFGDPQRGLEFGKRALRLNPRDPLIFRTFHAVTTGYIGIGDYQNALDTACDGLKYNSSNLALQLQKVSALARLRRTEEARSEAKNLLNRCPDFRISHFLSYRRSFQGSADMVDDLRTCGLPE